jgi:hypothetical protein
MTTIATLLLMIALIGYGLKEYYQVKLKSSPHSTPVHIQNQIVETLMSFSHTGRMADLGSGWGGMVLNLAKQMPEWQIDGVEQSPTPWVIANCRSTGKTYGNYRFFISPIQKFFLKNYDVIYVNLPRETLIQILPRLVRALQDDTLILSYPHPLPRLPTRDHIAIDDRHRVYMYRGVDAIAYAEEQRAQRLQEQQQTVAPEQTEDAVTEAVIPPVSYEIDQPPSPPAESLPLEQVDDNMLHQSVVDAPASPRD